MGVRNGGVANRFIYFRVTQVLPYFGGMDFSNDRRNLLRKVKMSAREIPFVNPGSLSVRSCIIYSVPKKLTNLLGNNVRLLGACKFNMISNSDFHRVKAFPMFLMPYRENLSGRQGIINPSAIDSITLLSMPRLGEVSYMM